MATNIVTVALCDRLATDSKRIGNTLAHVVKRSAPKLSGASALEMPTALFLEALGMPHSSFHKSWTWCWALCRQVGKLLDFTA